MDKYSYCILLTNANVSNLFLSSLFLFPAVGSMVEFKCGDMAMLHAKYTTQFLGAMAVKRAI